MIVNIRKIIEAINKTKKVDDIIHSKSRNGETVLLSFAASGNLKILEYFEKMNLSFNDCDNNGNNILHKIIESDNIDNEKIISHVSIINQKNPELILQYNNEGLNPFMVAGKQGFNGIIGLMSTVYPLKLLDSSTTTSILHLAAISQILDTIRYLVQNLHIDVNKQLEDGSTPLHWASKNSSLISYNELIGLGANPLICDNNILNAIDLFLLKGCEKYIDNISKTPSFNYMLSKSNILTKIVSNPEAYSLFLSITSQMDSNSISICDSEGKNTFFFSMCY